MDVLVYSWLCSVQVMFNNTLVRLPKMPRVLNKAHKCANSVVFAYEDLKFMFRMEFVLLCII